MAEMISAGPFATEKERTVAEVLRQLPNDWTVICNKILPSGDRSYEIDFIVIGRQWIFLLDEKSWRGKIQGNDQLWVRADGFSTRSPLTKADYVSKILAGHIKWKVTPLKEARYFVHSGVILSVAEQLPQIHDTRASNGIFLLGNVLERLQALDSQEGSSLIGQFSIHIKKALFDLSYRPQVPAKIDFWDIEDATTLRPGVRLFNAKMSSNPEQRRQLMVYDLGSEPLAQQELRDFYMRECFALQKLYATGHVPQVETPRIWSDDFLILPIVPPTGRALYVYPQPETREEFTQELFLAASSFKALSQFHAQNVIHRAIGPNTLYVQGGSSLKVIFTNFYAARIGTTSIAVRLDTLSIEDPYASIDLAFGYGYATPQTDNFSLALVFLERLSGTSLTDIRATVESEILFPAQPRWSAFLSPEFANELTTLFKQILTPLKDVMPPDANEIAKLLNELARRVAAQSQTIEGLILDKRYKVRRLLGTGAMAKTYLASDTGFESLDDLYALKQYISPVEVVPQVEAEFKALRDLSSPYFPRIYAINPPQYEVHVQMEYIPGPTLQQVEKEFPWSIERWWTFAQHLLNAVGILEQKGLLHRDIKPANIILHESDNRPVLIDFGFAIRQGIAGQAAGTPLYLPPEAMTMDPPPPSTDRYSLGVVLFKALLGYLPFTIDKLGKRVPASLEQITDEKIRRIAHVLSLAVANNPNDRPHSLDQLRQDLQTVYVAVEEPEVVLELQDKVNVWVNNVRSLYRNSDVGNQNNRGLDTPFVKETYVPTALDKKLLPAIFEQRPKIIFLSGNPGDGKTAFLEQVQQELQKRHAIQKQERSDLSGWEWEYKGHTFRSCYDASESHAGLSADEQLGEKLHGLEGAIEPSAPLTLLIAINDGRLEDYFSRKRAVFSWVAKQLERRNEYEGTSVWVIDLKKRAFVTMPDGNEPSVFREVLKRLVAPDKWKICEECAAQTVCPIRNNAIALRKTRITKRLEFLFLLSHLRQQRHTTMRDLRSALAYLITGNRSCEQVHSAYVDADAGASLLSYAYWQSAFAPVEKSDELLTDLIPLDPGRFPHPHLDRFLHFHQALKDVEPRSLLFTDKTDLAPQRFQNEHEWMAAFKRRLYFESKKLVQMIEDGNTPSIPSVRWMALLPYQYAGDFVTLLEGGFSDEDVKAFRDDIALGILRSDGIIEDVPEGMLSIKVSASEEQQLVVLKQLPIEDFVLRIEAPKDTHMVELLPEHLVLVHKHSGIPRLEITLDLFELLMKMADGLQPTAPEFRPLLEDLKLFKDTLLLRETRDLILIENQYKVHRVAQDRGKIIRTRLK
ncbi:MAG: protein kinase [Ktedonobacteraceae bacterium]